MIYLYCGSRKSTGAKDIAAWINAHGGQAKRVHSPVAVRSGDFVVNWGAGNDWPAGVKVLNRRTVHNKLGELMKLAAAGVSVPEHSQRRPSPYDGWLARTANHTEARDLLAGLTTGDYYTKYIPTEREFRVHVWNGVSIRAGVKMPRVANPHPRFRSWTAGWKLDYGVSPQYMRQSYREMAKKACAALGYDFGAVDLAVTADGRVVVFEVNSAPGLEGNTIEAYGKAILAASKGA